MRRRIATLALTTCMLSAAGCSDDTSPTPDGPVTDGPLVADAGPDGPVVDGPTADGQQPGDLAPDQPQKATGWYPVTGVAPKGAWQTATLLQDGTVLITGGYVEEPAKTTFKDAYLYDPKSGAFSKTGPMGVERCLHTATLLDDGRVLVAGGENETNDALDSTEVYDPKSGAFTAGPKLPEPRTRHTALRLDNGEVLIAGGIDLESFPSVLLGSLVIYTKSGTLKLPATAMKQPRYRHAACLLSSGKVLFAGGADFSDDLDSLEVFDPQAGTTTLLSAKLSYGRTMVTATLLKNGKVLLVGGSSYSPLNDDLYDPATNAITPLTHPGGPPAGHTATLLNDGSVLVVGGREANPYGGAKNMTATLAYDSTSGGAWTTLPDLTVGRAHHVAAKLNDGSVLVVGGMFGKSNTYVDTAEVFYR